MIFLRPADFSVRTGSVNSPTPDNDGSFDLIYFDCLSRTLSSEPRTLQPSDPDILLSVPSCVVTLNYIPNSAPKSQETSTYKAPTDDQGKQF